MSENKNFRSRDCSGGTESAIIGAVDFEELHLPFQREDKMAEKLLTTKPRKVAAKKNPADKASKREEIVVVGNYKTGRVDYPPKLGGPIVLARAADFGRRCAKVKKEDGFSVVVTHDDIKAKGYTLSAG